MHQITIVGDGHLGWAVASAAGELGLRAPVLGRPAAARHDPAAFERTDVAVDASVGVAVPANVDAALLAGVRRFVIATTGWAEDRTALDQVLRAHDASAVTSSNFSLGVALFGRLVERAAELFGAVDGFDPYLVEWHRRGKVDRPSATALDLGRRMVGRHPTLSVLD
ncbi:MAG: dihydrodipicolinate reductase C-terminal domain-containing protein, partial [Candidatus Limnocylindrales bacterium]